MPLMVNPYVTSVTLRKKQIVLTIKVDDYPPGEDLEISGQATQNGGAFAVFNGIKQVPEPNPDGTAYIYLEASPAQDFEKGHDITVVLRAARVWTTVLGEPPPGPEPSPDAARLPTTTGTAESSDEDTSWSVIRAVTYAAPPPSGNAGQNPAGSEASFPGT